MLYSKQFTSVTQPPGAWTFHLSCQIFVHFILNNIFFSIYT